MKRQSSFTRLALLIFAISFGSITAQQATWIWYPGDYDIWLANEMQNRRTERGTFFPPFWKIDSHYNLVEFSKKIELTAPEEIEIAVEGKYNVKLDGKMLTGSPAKINLGAGKHSINIKVFNQQNVPSIYVKGKTIISDNSWNVTYEDKEWIDESGKASDVSATIYLKAASWNFNSPGSRPSNFRLPVEPKPAVKLTRQNRSILADYGSETFGFIKLHGVTGSGTVNIYYGESPEEALSQEFCETLDKLELNEPAKTDCTLKSSKAFRYANIVCGEGVTVDSVSMLYEYMPEKIRGSFRCSDEQINKIWDVARYTFQLNTREFFIDGIKRDRWIWSGDAYQSYLMNYYLFFDDKEVTRTLAALRGKDPVTSHINTIMDYTFYWFLGIYDYYMYTGDENFIKAFYGRMSSLMDYCLSRRNKNGFMEGLSGDWVYIDWAPLEKIGEVSFEQILFCRALETMSLCAGIVNNKNDEAKYKQLAGEMRGKFAQAFWNNDKGAFVHNRVNGTQSNTVTRYTNMFAVFFDYLNAAQKISVKNNVLLNKNVQSITTPYMRFYELEALCALGDQNYVMNEIKNYWGGMLNAGATTFWEKYDPSESGVQHYAMYGRQFGKSLCHAWGASPIYLLGKYFLGVKPTAPGYTEYVIEPNTGGLEWIEGTVPIPGGDIYVYCSKTTIKVKAGAGRGTLRIKSSTAPKCTSGESVKSLGGNVYEVAVGKGLEVRYSVVN
jgi:alpha-L-rhamnosidase